MPRRETGHRLDGVEPRAGVGVSPRGDLARAQRTEHRFSIRLGTVVVGLALLTALVSFLIFTGYTPIEPTDDLAIDLFVANIGVVVVLLALVVIESARLVSAWRRRVAGARLHLRIVGLFSIIAAVPAVIMAIVGAVTLERGLYPVFMQDVRGFISNTAEAARLYRESQCQSLLREADLTASDLDRAKVGFDNRTFFHDFFTSRVKILGFTTAVMMKSDGTVLERVDTGSAPEVARPESADFEDAKKGEPLCFLLSGGRTFVALRYLPSFQDTYLYVARPIDPFAIEFARGADQIVTLYDSFDQHRRSIQLAFILMYALLAAIMLLSAVWLGLSFANRLVAPIRRLINAADQVSSGNLYVQVPVRRSEGDLAHLGETFNKMTSELRLQQNRLMAANHLIDERRMFTEAVLSGVPAAIVGVDTRDEITVVNPSAHRLFGIEAASSEAVGQHIANFVPELAPAITEARVGRMRLHTSQVTLSRAGRDRVLNVRITAEPSPRAEQNLVVTLDDITELVSAQRTSAWADVARRIAHEIKNPLTPIQLSAERLKRRYGRVITEGRDVFDQCTDTIIRQVDDIKRMVDEFSSFARMPKANPERDDLAACVRQVVFLMKVGHPDVVFDEEIADGPLVTRFDRRLISQALTNIIKNATEGIAAEPGQGARITVSLRTLDARAVIDVTDTGKGFPAENRQRLLEPYMTTRAEGTGLGLPIVAKILEEHGGSIELLDPPDGARGARVRLSFPIIDLDGAGAADEVAPATAAAKA